MSILTAVYYILGLIVAFAAVSASIMFTVELFHHLQLITDRCDMLEKELKKCKATLKTFEADIVATRADTDIMKANIVATRADTDIMKANIVATRADTDIMKANIVATRADADIMKADIVAINADVAGTMMSLQESIEDLYAKEKKAKEDRNSMKLLDRCIMEMRSRITVVETRSEHTVEKTDDILECLSLLQERIAANEESAKTVAELKDFVGHLHELGMAGNDKTERLKIETNKLRTVVSILQQRASAPTGGRNVGLPLDLTEDYHQKYNFGF